VAIGSGPSVLPVHTSDTCTASATPPPAASEGALTWSLVGEAASIEKISDTQAVIFGESRGNTVISVRYEGEGLTQGYDDGTQSCTVIDVTIDSAPTWVVSGAPAETLVASAGPPPGQTSGTLQWALLDDNDTPVGWATFNPNGTAASETTLFSVSTSDTGPFTLRVGYTVSGVTAYDTRLIDVISGEVSVVPSLGFVSPGATFQYQAMDGDGDAYDSSEVTWSMDEGDGSVDAEGLYTAPSDTPGRMVVKATLNGSQGLVYDTAVVGVIATDLDAKKGAYSGSLKAFSAIKSGDNYYAQDRTTSIVPILIYWAHELSNEEVADKDGNPVAIKRKWGWVEYDQADGEGAGQKEPGVPSLSRWISAPSLWTVIPESHWIFDAVSCVAQLFGYPSLDAIRQELGVSKDANHELAATIHWGYGKARLRCEWYPEEGERNEEAPGKNLTIVKLHFVDEIPDYSSDISEAAIDDSDNFFLRQGTDHDVKIHYEILPSDAELDFVKINIYHGLSDTAWELGKDEDADLELPQTAGEHTVKWDVRNDAGQYRSQPFYRVQLEVRPKGATESLATSVDDAEEDTPGWHCPQQCLGVHDLIWKHRPIVHVHHREHGAPTSIGEFVANSNLLTWTGGDRAGQVFLDFLRDSRCSTGAFEDFTEEQRQTLYTRPGTETLYYSANEADSSEFLFLQYWMFENFSTTPDGSLFTPGTDSVWHEGDLEYVQVAVRLSGEPTSMKSVWLTPFAATAAQHYYGQTLGWSPEHVAPGDQAHAQEYVEHRYSDSGEDRLVIYIARGAHATYFVPDEDIEVPDIPMCGFGRNDPYVYDPSPESSYDDTSPCRRIHTAMAPLSGSALYGPAIDYWGWVGHSANRHDAPPCALHRYAVDDANDGEHVEVIADPVRFHNGCICPQTPHGEELRISQ